ncbi:apolipoprotein N-acyltransferase [bacterium]|nr:apolipoprotein N-acyltransferase [bacterium]
MVRTDRYPVLSTVMRIVFLLAGSVAMAFSLPHRNLWILAWIALIPLFEAVTIWKSRTFLLAWLYGTTFFAVSFSWVTHSMVFFGGISWFIAGGLLLLMSAFFGLFPAFSVWLAQTICRESKWKKYPALVWSLIWVAFEYLRAHLPFGFAFPWNSLGQSQHSVSTLLQNADWGSFYGLSFMIVFVNISICAALRKTDIWKSQLIASVVIVVFAWSYGMIRLNGDNPAREFKIGIIQGNVDLNEKWLVENRHDILMDQIILSKELEPGKPDLFLWSESALPFMHRFAWRYDGEENSSLGLNLARFLETTHVPLLTGTLDRVEDNIYNAAVLAFPDGKTEYYYKQKLVPFGEYVPLEKLFFFVNRIVDQGIGTFSSGNSLKPLEIPDGPRIAMTICYENIFPGLVRDRVNAGGEIICNIMNDVWFGDISAPYQHFAAAQFRAVETRRPVIRCANTGISGAVDSAGRILAMSSLFTRESFIVSVNPSSDMTLYLRFGDWFAGGCVLLTILVYFRTFIGKIRKDK